MLLFIWYVHGIHECIQELESFIRNHIMEQFKINNIFNDNQYGFIKERSTTLQLLSVLDMWTKDLEDSGQIDVIYTDFEKAFDRVPHRRLIGKLESYGIHSNGIKWIEAFLLARKQKVRINNLSLSKWQSVISRIPQGSVLEPLLFVIYMLDLIKNCTSEFICRRCQYK